MQHATACSPDVLAYTASTWTAVIVACSIFVPLGIAIVLYVLYLTRWKDDEEADRLRRQQTDYEASKRDEPRRQTNATRM